MGRLVTDEVIDDGEDTHRRAWNRDDTFRAPFHLQPDPREPMCDICFEHKKLLSSIPTCRMDRTDIGRIIVVDNNCNDTISFLGGMKMALRDWKRVKRFCPKGNKGEQTNFERQ